MLTENEVVDKLRDYGQKFDSCVKKKEWGKAHNLYNIALSVATFVELPDQIMKELFGYGEDATEDGGLFRIGSVRLVDRECCIRRNMAYEDMACRKKGLPLELFRCYSEEDFCARCEKGHKKS